MIQSVLEPITTLTSNSATVPFANDDVRTRSANCCGWLQKIGRASCRERV